MYIVLEVLHIQLAYTLHRNWLQLNENSKFLNFSILIPVLKSLIQQCKPYRSNPPRAEVSPYDNRDSYADAWLQ